jgi:hypothetical protein
MAGLSPRKFFSKPIRRLEPIERPAEEARAELKMHVVLRLFKLNINQIMRIAGIKSPVDNQSG